MTSLKEWMTSSPSRLTSFSSSNNILILDGGVSTYLEYILQKPFTHRSLWSSSLLLHQSSEDERAAIRKCHSDFYLAGSDMITTVTYQCSHIACHRPDNITELHLTEEDIDEMLLYGLKLACDIRQEFQSCMNIQQPYQLQQNREYYVVASLGCYGATLANGAEYTGKYTFSYLDKDHDDGRISQREVTVKDLIVFHQRRYRIMTNRQVLTCKGNYPNGVAFETIPCIDEVRAIGMMLLQLDSCNDHHEDSDHAVWISLACKDENHLNDGTSLEVALNLIDELDPNGKRIHGVGINCFDLRYLASLVHLLVSHIVRTKINRAIIFYPNSGEEWDPVSSKWIEGSGCTLADKFASCIVQDGLTIIDNYLENHGHGILIPIIVGGCCRTDPTTIKEIKKQVNAFQEKTYTFVSQFE